MAKDISFDSTMWRPLTAPEALAALNLAINADHDGLPLVTIAAINQVGAQQLTQRHPALKSMFSPVLVDPVRLVQRQKQSGTESPASSVRGGLSRSSSYASGLGGVSRTFSVDDVVAVGKKYMKSGGGLTSTTR